MFKVKKPSMGEVWIFSGTAHFLFLFEFCNSCVYSAHVFIMINKSPTSWSCLNLEVSSTSSEGVGFLSSFLVKCSCFVSFQDILTANEPGGCVKNQISVHNVVHPYRFTRDMLTDMRVLRQLDDKFIVGVVSQEGEIHGWSFLH